MISGDIVADKIHDTSGACAAESQDGGHDSCHACGCTIHNGSAMPPDAVAVSLHGIGISVSMPLTDDQPAIGVAPAIDHPPQLVAPDGHLRALMARFRS
ncbi:MAG: hypothetical protein H0X73_14545 [Chthoniobacterales bacterium]|nr:hypothetical protein [Chthoniobacterales bacterium]